MVALAVREGQTLEVPLGEALIWKHPGAELGGLIRQGVALEAPRCYLLLQATCWGCRAVVQLCLVTALLGSVTALFGYSKSFNRTGLPS